MTINYIIEDTDFLTYQLYNASKSEAIKKRRKRSKVIMPLIYIVLGLYFLIQDNHLLALIFIVIGLLWFFLFPIWERRHYLNHFKRFIKENYKGRLGRNVILEFNNEFIFAKDNGSESKVLTTEIEEIAEIPTTILIKLKGGQSLIIPKAKITDIDLLIISLKELTNYLNIKYITDDKWEWK